MGIVGSSCIAGVLSSLGGTPQPLRSHPVSVCSVTRASVARFPRLRPLLADPMKPGSPAMIMWIIHPTALTEDDFRAASANELTVRS